MKRSKQVKDDTYATAIRTKGQRFIKHMKSGVTLKGKVLGVIRDAAYPEGMYYAIQLEETNKTMKADVTFFRTGVVFRTKYQ